MSTASSLPESHARRDSLSRVVIAVPTAIGGAVTCVVGGAAGVRVLDSTGTHRGCRTRYDDASTHFVRRCHGGV
jgi:hypothetical protein